MPALVWTGSVISMMASPGVPLPSTAVWMDVKSQSMAHTVALAGYGVAVGGRGVAVGGRGVVVAVGVAVSTGAIGVAVGVGFLVGVLVAPAGSG